MVDYDPVCPTLYLCVCCDDDDDDDDGCSLQKQGKFNTNKPQTIWSPDIKTPRGHKPDFPQGQQHSPGNVCSN